MINCLVVVITLGGAKGALVELGEVESLSVLTQDNVVRINVQNPIPHFVDSLELSDELDEDVDL